MGSIPAGSTTDTKSALRQISCVVLGAAMISEHGNPRAGVAKIPSDDEELFVTPFFAIYSIVHTTLSSFNG